MKTNGSIYVAAVFAALAGYFVYQWWFNPNRIVKTTLGTIAAALSVPANEQDVERLARLARLRALATSDVHVKVGTAGPNLTSRDAALAAIAALRPPGGWSVDFVDVDVRVNEDDTARAFATAEVTSKDPQTGQQTLDARDVTLSFVRRDNAWLVREAEVKDLPK